MTTGPSPDQSSTHRAASSDALSTVNSNVALSARNVRKRFGRNDALQGVDVAVAPGEIVALLGPNGAGKSTLIRIFATAVLPDHGKVQVAGFDVVDEPRNARASLGIVLSDERSFFWRLSGQENLEFFASLHGMRRREARRRSSESLSAVGLSDVADRRVDRYSTGMRARLGIARALLGSPKALLLDEFTRSVDPIGTIEVRELVARMATERQVAILIATHDLHEAAAIADRTLILVAGRVATSVDGGHDAASLEALLVQASAAGAIAEAG